MQQFVQMVQDTVRFLVSLVRVTFRSVRDNKGLAAISVVLAFGIWIAVTNADNPTTSKVVPYDLVVEPINVADDIAVVKPVGGQDLHLRVRVSVADSQFDSLTKGDFLATVDLQGYTVGEYKLPVKVEAANSSSNLRVESWVPEEITVRLARLVSKQVPVNINVSGEPPSGYLPSLAEPKDESVLVSGAQDDVDKVTQVAGNIDISGQTDTVTNAVRLSARDAAGNLVPGVDVKPDLTNVTVEIAQQKFTRAMVITPNITTSPADGYNVVSVQVSPTTVTVRGDEAFINGTSAISTKPIDISGAADDVVKTVALDIPTGAEVTGGAAVVTVTIKIEPVVGTFNFSVPVAARNLGGDVAISGALPTVTVQLTGPKPLLESLSPNDIAASIDLDGKDAGVTKVKVDVTAPDGTTVSSVTPAEVDITLVKR